jgi:hypothetical protein
MEKETFRYFLRKVHGLTEPTNEECDEICDSFMTYLNNKCTPKQLDNFMPQSVVEVVMGQGNPFKMDGFHPAFVLHFQEYVKKTVESQLNQDG